MRALRSPRAIAALTLLAVGFLLQVGLQAWMRPHAIEGVWFQQWCSDAMMQTAPLLDLRERPLESLLYLHIQPPGFDVLRAVLAALWPDADPVSLVTRVDSALYLLCAALYAVSGVVVFLWLDRLIPRRWALAVGLLFLLHPASIFYATLLEGTLLTSLLVLVAYRELWELGRSPEHGVIALALAFAALALTRSLFQWPMLAVFVAALGLLRVPRRKLLIFVLIAGTAAGGLALKNRLLFGSAATSSFTGLNLVRSLGLEVRYHQMLFEIPEAGSRQPTGGLPSVLTRERKIVGQTNLNHHRYLEFDRQLQRRYVELLRERSAGELLAAYGHNLRLWLQPSSRYTEHRIVDRLPWRRPYDLLFSFPVLPILLLVGIALSWRSIRGDPRRALGLLLPAAAIVSASILFESGENMRFKFFVEPLLFVWWGYLTLAWIAPRVTKEDEGA